MTPKEKAFELILKIETELIDNRVYRGTIKNLALIAVEIAIKCCKDYDEVHENYTTQVDHWMEVKQEIEKL